MTEDERCVVCGGMEEVEERRVAHEKSLVCDFCWSEYSLAEIISEVGIR